MKLKATVWMLAVAGCVPAAWGQEQAGQTAAKATELEAIEVYAEPRGGRVIGNTQIGRTPTRNGTVNELLRNHGAVQFSDTGNLSSQAGEISPELVSFHGEPYYNNSFLIDGLSNNDIMNPGFSNGGHKSPEVFEQPTMLYLAPGAPESFQVASSLLDRLEVYDSNVPAKYSGFTGGVVSAEIKDPDLGRSGGSAGFRTTRSSWTDFHLSDREAADNFYAADAANDYQPRFVKHNYSLTANQPLSSRAALMFGYSRTQSKIPEYHSIYGSWMNERRLSETWLLKGLYQAGERHRLNATFMYSPHESVFHRNETRNGRYVSSGGGWRFGLDSRYRADWGDIRSAAAYIYQRNRIAYDGGYDFYGWLPGTPSVGWCSQMGRRGCQYAMEGGLGTLMSDTKTLTFKQDYELNPLQWGSAAHRLSFGWQADFVRAHSERPQDVRYMFMYSNAANGHPANITNVSRNCTECLPGEQYQTRMVKYRAYSADVGFNRYTAYVSDRIELGRVRLTPGLNLSYDSFLGNLNAAPRFSFDIDLSGSNRLNLTGGLNRYYADSMLAYALRAKIPYNEVWTRRNDPLNGAGPWTFGNYGGNSQFWDTSRLNTPYSDEAALGLRWRFGNHILNAGYVHRESRDQFTPERTADGVQIMGNGGRGRSDNFSFTLAGAQPVRWGRWSFAYRLGARYHKPRTNHHGNYDEDLVADVTTRTTPYYLFEGGRYESVSQLPPFNFNRPWEAFVELHTDIPDWHFRWTHTLNYRSAYRQYLRHNVAVCAESSQPQACGDWNGRVYDYRQTDFKNALTLDWRFLWDIPFGGQKRMEISLDVLNVLNNRNAAGSNKNTYLGGSANQARLSYETGRQYWFGMSYRW